MKSKNKQTNKNDCLMRMEEGNLLKRHRRKFSGGDENVLFLVLDGNHTSVHNFQKS